MARDSARDVKDQVKKKLFTDLQEEEEAFQAAMANVNRRPRTRTVRRKNGLRKPLRSYDAEKEGRRQLDDFVRGKSRFDWVFHPEYREGGPQQRNSRLLRRLRRGDFSVQAHLDLHGLTRAEAFDALEDFLYRSRRRQLRCVRVIHGKGKNSINQEGILKRKVPEWLSMKRLARQIVAFASARPEDGGLGATYVLLRKPRR